MIINVTGGKAYQRKYVESITTFVVQKLMPRMRNLEFNINLKTIHGACGYCLATDDADSQRPREFDIEIKKDLPLRTLLETVAHELVHAKQFARGELYQSSVTAKHRWQGEWLNSNPEYWDLPWEIEAHGRELGLFIRWCEQSGYAGKKWANLP